MLVQDLACSEFLGGGSCPWMAMNNLEKIIHALENNNDEIDISPELAQQAMKPLNRMLSFAI